MTNSKPSFEPIKINELDITLYFQEDYIFKDVSTINLFQVKIIELFKLFFGVNPSTITDDLTDAITNKVRLKYPNLTFSQLKDCFYNQTIEKKEYVSVSVDEFVKNIDFWDKKRRKIRIELERIELEQKQEELKKQKQEEFNKHCDVLLQESIKAGKWLGDYFEAFNLLSRNYNDLIKNVSKDFKKRVWILCIKKQQNYVKMAKNNMESNLIHKLSVVNHEYLFAKYILNKILKEWKS